MMTSSDIGMAMRAVNTSAKKHPKEMAQLVHGVRQSLDCKEPGFNFLSKISAEDSNDVAVTEECYALIALGIAAGTMLPSVSMAWIVAGVGRA
jgi:hypothetical protein